MGTEEFGRQTINHPQCADAGPNSPRSQPTIANIEKNHDR